MPWYEDICDLAIGRERLQAARYGMIEAVNGRFRRVQLRPFPRLVTFPEVAIVGRFRHKNAARDQCRLFYDQPWRFPNFLAVKYLISGLGTSYHTLLRCLQILDEIARIKHTDALLCDVANSRISDRFLRRQGWQPHCKQAWHRNYIKRFYGIYPEPAAWILGQGARDPAEPEQASCHAASA